MKGEYTIYLNDVKLLHTIPGYKKYALSYIRTFLKDTHMGGWVRTTKGYEYNTTIGRYYRFERN